jgi:hypothetical protein
MRSAHSYRIGGEMASSRRLLKPSHQRKIDGWKMSDYQYVDIIGFPDATRVMAPLWAG